MAIFKKKDRSRRTAAKALHESAMFRARQVYELSYDVLPDNSARAAWREYTTACAEYLILPHTFQTFKRELTGA